MMRKEALINAIIDAYHTAKLIDIPVDAHILSRRSVQKAFESYDGIHHDIVYKIGPVRYGATEAKSDAEHVDNFMITLALTRKHYGLIGPRQLHGVYVGDSETVLCHTGTSPNSANHAAVITQAWNNLL